MVFQQHASLRSEASNGPGELVRRVAVHLRVSFNAALSDDDREDIAQSAYCELVEKLRRGERIERPLALLKRIAWRDACDLLRHRREVPTDPGGGALSSLPEPGPDPEERLLKRAELARALVALEALKPVQVAALRASALDGLNASEASARIGRSQRAYFGYLKDARGALEESRSGERFATAERALLAAYLRGAATEAERRSATRLIEADPHAAALARRLSRQDRRRRRAPGSVKPEPDSQTTGGTRCWKSQARS